MSGFFLSECEPGEPARVPCDRADIWAYTRAGPDKTTDNEDAAAVYLTAGGQLVLAVADGLGGMPAGGTASRLALDVLEQELMRTPSEAQTRAPILDAFERANQEVRELGGGTGTTLAVAEVGDGRLRPYHVGDSAVLVVGQRGRTRLETMAHSPVGYGVAAGLIDPEAALHHDDRHYLSNHVGSADMHIEMGSPIGLAHHDTVLLATDGLFDNLHADEIVERIRKGPIEAAARSLASLCGQRMAGAGDRNPAKPDDVTFVLVRGAGRQAASA